MPFDDETDTFRNINTLEERAGMSIQATVSCLDGYDPVCASTDAQAILSP